MINKSTKKAKNLNTKDAMEPMTNKDNNPKLKLMKTKKAKKPMTKAKELVIKNTKETKTSITKTA